MDQLTALLASSRLHGMLRDSYEKLRALAPNTPIRINGTVDARFVKPAEKGDHLDAGICSHSIWVTATESANLPNSVDSAPTSMHGTCSYLVDLRRDKVAPLQG